MASACKCRVSGGFWAKTSTTSARLGDAAVVVRLVAVGDDLGDAIGGRGSVGFGKGGRNKADAIAAVRAAGSEVELPDGLRELADGRQPRLAAADEDWIAAAADAGRRFCLDFPSPNRPLTA